MRVLIACEESQRVCQAFRDKGHEAYSCDILPTSGDHPEWHIQDDVLNHLNEGWDLMIAHPPCTYLSTVGNRWMNADRAKRQIVAFDFFMNFIKAPIERICVENPQGYVNTHYRVPDQVIHPYYFGHPDKKRTCLWLKGLPKLLWDKKRGFVDDRTEPQPYYICQGTRCKGKKMYLTECNAGRTKGEWAKERSRTFTGIARAMAEQWGNTTSSKGANEG